MGADKISVVKVLLTTYCSFSLFSDDKVEMFTLPTDILKNKFVHLQEIQKFIADFAVQLSVLAYSSR